MYFTSELGAMSLAGVKEVHEFPPGHYCTPTDGFIHYYQLPKVNKSPLVNVESICLRIRNTFTWAVKKRLLADPQVPLGSLFVAEGLILRLLPPLPPRKFPISIPLLSACAMRTAMSLTILRLPG